jgi:hypothetical protein
MRLIALLTLFFGAHSLASAQNRALDLPLDSATHLVTYSGVVQRPGAPEAELYALAKRWFTAVFSIPNGESVSFNEAAGTMEGTQHRYYDNTIGGSAVPQTSILWYTVRAAVKDGQYSYTISHFRLAKYPGNPTPYLPTGPIEAFILAQPANHILRDLTEQQRQHIKAAVENFLLNFNGNMKSKP